MSTTAVALCVFLFAILAQAAQAPAGWVKYTSPEGRYSVRLPKEPELSTQDTTATAGEKVKQYLALSADSGSMAIITYFDYGSDITFSLDKARDGMISAVKGTLLAERAISLGGHPGRELRVEAKAPEGLEFIIRARYYDVARRIYVVQFVFPKSAETPAIAEKGDKFFDSFTVEPGR